MPLEQIKGVSTQGGYSTSPGQKISVEKVGSSAAAGNVPGTPITMIPDLSENFLAKSQNLFFSDFEISDQKFLSNPVSLEKQIEATLESFQPVFEEAKINEEHALSSKMPEPLAVFSFKKNDAQNIISALYQAYLEDTCSQKFSERVFQIIKQNDPIFFDSLDKSINSEIETAQSIVSVLELIFSQIEQADTALISKSSNGYKFEQYYFKEFAGFFSGADGQGRFASMLGEIKNLFDSCAKDPTMSLEKNEKSQTTLITQILQLVYLALYQGSTTMILGEKMIKIPAGADTIAQQTIKKTENPSLLTLSQLSSSGNSQSSYIYGQKNLVETQPYTALVDISSLVNTKSIRKIAYLMNLVSNEMTVSTGLARLAGTPLGNRYTNIDNFLGTSNIKNAHTETKKENSLTDALVVSEDGAVTTSIGLWSVEPGKKKVLLYDGNNFRPTQKLTNATSAFLKPMLKNPSDANVNKIQGLEQNITNAAGLFSEGTEFFKQLYLADKKLSSLSPRGLFTRLLRAFATHLNYAGTAGSYKVTKNELALLSLVAKNTVTNDPQEPGNIIKRYMLFCLARTALAGVRPDSTASLFSQKTSIALKSANEESASANALVAALETQLNNLLQAAPQDQSQIKLVTSQLESAKKKQAQATANAANAATSAANAEKSGQISFSASVVLPPGKIRFSNDDKKLLEGFIEQQSLTDEFLFSFFNLSKTDTTAIETAAGNFEKLSFTPLESLKQAYQISKATGTNSSSFLDEVASIFVEFIQESESILKETTKGAEALVTSDGLTKNSGIDGTTILAMLLEASCILSGMFVNVKKGITVANQYSENLLKEAKGAKGFQDATRELLKNSKLDLEISVAKFLDLNGAAVNSNWMLQAICSASESDDFVNFVTIKNGVEVVPEQAFPNFQVSTQLGVPVQTVISNESDDTTIADFVEVMKDLADERNMPIIFFSAAKSLVLASNDAMSGIIKTGKQLLGVEKQTPEIKEFINFSKTTLGQNYFSALNEFTFDATKKSFLSLKQSWQSPSKRSPRLSQGIYNCLSVIFPEVIARKDSLAFMTVGLPTDYVKNSVQFNFSLKRDRSDIEKTSTLQLSVYKKPVFSKTDYEPLEFNFYVRPIFDDQSFAQFTGEAKQLPISLTDIVNKCILDTGKTGLKEKSQKIDTAASQEILENEVVSFLFRKAFSVLSSADLFENNISYKNFQVRSAQSVDLARRVAETYGLPPSTFDGIFISDNEFGTVLDRTSLVNLSVDKFTDAASSVIIEPKFFSFGEAELFYDLFSTVYFMAGRINDMVFVPTVLDRTIGVMFSPEEFKKYEKKEDYQNLKTNQAISKLVSQQCTIDSYSVDVNPSTSLENK